MGPLLIAVGLALTLAGAVLTVIGRLPGDVVLQKGNLTVVFPVVTCILVSVLLTVLLNVFSRR